MKHVCSTQIFREKPKMQVDFYPSFGLDFIVTNLRLKLDFMGLGSSLTILRTYRDLN
jgi:hypothetical protein